MSAGGGSRSGTGAPIERELKLSVRKDFHLPDMTTVPGLSMVSQPEKTLVAQYYDTAGLDLARWGATLRYRATGETGEWTVKLQPPPPEGSGADDKAEAAATVDRYEIEFQAPAGEVPAPALELTAGLRRGRALEVVAELTTVRRGHLILDPDGNQLAELDDDTVEFTTRQDPPGAGGFREIEVELLGDGSGDSKWTHTVYDLLAASGARRNDGAPKLIRALGRVPDRPAPAPRVKSSASTSQVVSAVIGAGLHRYLTYEPSLHLGAEPGPVRQCRVAARRLATQIDVLAPLLEPPAALAEGLEPILEALGLVRRADRIEARLRSYRGRLEVAERAELDGMTDLVHAEREAAAAALGAAVAGEDHGRALDAVFALVADPPLVSPDRPGADALLPLLGAEWSELERAVRRLPDLETAVVTDDQLHGIRRRARRCRYAADMAAPVLGRAGGLAKAVRDVQDILGEVQQASVTVAWLRSTGLAGTSGRALVAGRLIALEAARAEQARRRWEQAWDRVSQKRRVKWLAQSS